MALISALGGRPHLGYGVTMRLLLVTALLLGACQPEAADPYTPPPDEPQGIEAGLWDPRLPPLDEVAAPRGLRWQRAVFHLHTPWSHDACDGRGIVDGEPDADCLADLREGLCATRYDAAFITDHPAHADTRAFDELVHPQAGDELLSPGVWRLACPDGGGVIARPGFEAALMPVGLREHVASAPDARRTILRGRDAESLAQMELAGGRVMLAHTESRDVEELIELQDAGLHAVEAFNVHAMFAPNIRVQHLGLDGTAWVADIGPFTQRVPGIEPDLLFLAVLEEQAPSIAAWDALLARGPMMHTAGSDAHQNVLPTQLIDDERVDSFRRNLRWFSTWLLADTEGPEGIDAAIGARRSAIVFEALGTPVGLDLAFEGRDGVVEAGGEAVGSGVLHVGCPALSPWSPHNGPASQITVHVFKDGEPFHEGCGELEVGPGVYRVRVDMVPHHLEGFLGELADRLVRPYPWIYTGAVRVVSED